MTDRLTEAPDHHDETDAEAHEPLRCGVCGHVLASPDDVISIGGEPALRVQVNPHGVAFEVLTLARAHGLVPASVPETDHSWFTGYAWTIVLCAECGTHLGWRFDATGDGSPARFWGLVAGKLSGLR